MPKKKCFIFDKFSNFLLSESFSKCLSFNSPILRLYLTMFSFPTVNLHKIRNDNNSWINNDFLRQGPVSHKTVKNGRNALPPPLSLTKCTKKSLYLLFFFRCTQGLEKHGIPNCTDVKEEGTYYVGKGIKKSW